MDIILLERVEKLGQMGDAVTVKNGFARNYLLPQGKAVRATKANIAAFEAKKIELEAQNLASKKEAEAVSAKMDGVEVVLIRQASESGQLYGSVNARDIAESLSQEGFHINRTQVLMERPTKTIGIFGYRIKLHPEVTVEVFINVAQSQEEAKAQSERRAKGEDIVITAADLDAKAEAEARATQAAEIAKAAKAVEAEAEVQDS